MKNSKIKNSIESLVSKLRNDPEYRIRTTYPISYLLMVLWYRAFQIFRGFFLKIKLKKSKGIIFCGRRVTIEHGYLVTAGESLIIEDNVFINALSENGLSMGRNVNIGKSAILICSGVIANKGVGIKIGNHSAVGAQSFLGGQGGIEIGDEVIIGPAVKIFSENHNFKDPNIPIRKQGESRKGVVIGNNCWIGSGAIILDGAKIGSGCVIAAGAIVSKDVPDNSVYYNKSERVIKSRFE